MSVTARRLRRISVPVDPETATRFLYWWLLLAIFFEYARPTEFVPGLSALPLNSGIPLSLLVVSTFAKGLRPIEDIFKDSMAKWIFIYFGLVAVSVVHAEVTMNAYQVFTSVMGYVILFVMIVRIVTSKKRLLGVFATLAFAHLFLLAMNPAVLLNAEVRNYIQGATFLGDGNDFSLSVCILLPMVVQLAVATRLPWLRLVWSGALLVLLLALISTQSRGASLALIAVAAYLWVASPRKWLTLAVVILSAAIVFLYASDAYFERMRTIAHYQEEGSAMGRIVAWRAGAQMLADHPLLGVGAGHFSISFGTTYRPATEGPMPWLTAHSMYFLIIGELGLPGIATLLTIVFGNMLANSRLRRRLLSVKVSGEPAALQASAMTLRFLNASMVGFSVAGTFLSVAYYPHIFVLTGLMVSYRRTVLATNPAILARSPASRSRANSVVRREDAAAPVSPEARGSPRTAGRANRPS